MAAYRFTEDGLAIVGNEIKNAIKRRTGIDVGLNFIKENCYMKESSDVIEAILICDEKKVLKVFDDLENSSYYPLLIQRQDKLWKYSLEIDFEFSMNEWGGDVHISLMYFSKHNVIPIDYNLYINSDEWRLKRNYILNKRGYKCERCFSKKNLQIHHITYENLGFELDNDLIILCKNCHQYVHQN